MLERGSFFKNERYLGYLMGAGVILMILALLLEGFGTIENGATTGSIFVVGLALFLLGLLTWFYMFRPWKRFDDLKTPHFTGEHAPDKAAHEAEHAAEEAAAPARRDVPATVPTPQTAIEPHVIQMPGPKVETAAKAAADAVKDTAQAAADAAGMGADLISEQKVEEAAPMPSRAAAPTQPDDLTIVEGIGPKTNAALQAAGVTTFAALAEMTPEAISALLSAAKVRIVSPPDTWPQQAKLAAEGDMEGLAKLQARLKGGLLKD